MPTTPNYGWTLPTVGANLNTWGDVLDAAFNDVDGELKAVSDVANTAPDMLPKAGGTMTGDIALGDPTPGSASSAGFRGRVPNTQDNTYTLVLKDAGKMILHTSGTPHTWTIPANSTVAFPIGTVILFGNVGAGTITVGKAVGVATLDTLGNDNPLSVSQHSKLELFKLATDTWYYRYF